MKQDSYRDILSFCWVVSIVSYRRSATFFNRKSCIFYL